MRKFDSIQALRAVAVLCVTGHHVAAMIGKYYPAPSWIVSSGFGELGAMGVDLFFVISGFIMRSCVKSAENSFSGAMLFLRRRIIRIYPTYWLWTIILLLIWIAGIGLKNHHYEILEVAKSFFLIPNIVNGEVAHPVLDQGWTLSFECYFYLCCAALIPCVSGKMFSSAIMLLMGMLSLFVYLFAPQLVPFFGSSLLLEFLYGVLACDLLNYLYGMRNKVAAASIVVALSAVLIFGCVNSQIDSPRCVAWGWPALAVFLLCVYFVANKDYFFKKWLVSLGDASYSVYLTHGFSTLLIGGLLKKTADYAYVNADLLVAVFTCAIVCVCTKAYLFIEKPILNFLNGTHKLFPVSVKSCAARGQE